MANTPHTRRRRRWLSVGTAVIALAIVAALVLNTLGADASTAQQSIGTTITVDRGTIVATVAASGTVAAVRTLDQSFQTSGTVTEVLVEAGQAVKAGDVLARLDTRDLELAVGEAQAALNSTTAQLEQAKQGNATEEQKAAAQAQVDNAQAQLEKAKTGGNTAADIKNAEAAVRQAQANLQQTRTGNNTAADVANAEAAVRQAEANLQQTRTGNNTAADVANAEAALRSAEASLEKTRKGTTTPADIANAEAQVRSAEASLQKAKTSNVTPEDIANAEAKLRSAEAALQKAQQGPKPDVVSSAEANVEQAQQNYDKTAAQASANKSSAEQSMQQAADSVRLAQEDYSTAYWNYNQAKEGNDPSSGKKINDVTVEEATVKRQYQAALTQAELNLNQAKSKLEQAKLSYEQAKHDEIVDVQSAQTQLDDAKVQLQEVLRGPEPEDVAQAQATVDQARNDLQKLKNGGTEADVAIAQANLDQAKASLAKLRQGPTAQEIAIAQASVDQAKANLAKTKQGGTAAEIAASQASVDQAQANVEKARQGGAKADIDAAQAQLEQQQANLEQLSAPATQTDLNIQSASVEQAEQAVKRAQLNLEAATLKAPFAGIVTKVNIVPGSIASNAAAALTLVDRSTLHVDLKLSENDTAKVQQGQNVTLTIDSLSGWRATGEVSYIAPAAETTNDVVTYGARVSFPDDDARVKVGMTANVDITTATKNDVLLVPNTALLPKGTGRVVQAPNANGEGTHEVEVQTGLTDGTHTEIVGGLEAGDQIVARPTTESQNQPGGFFGQ